jgi:carbonic anhydrase
MNRTSHPGGELSLEYQSTMVQMINNGHTIQVNVDPGSMALIKDRPYKLRQLHFHEPSEHHWEGKRFTMELHLVHQEPNGHVAVVAVPMELGAENRTLAGFWNQLPKMVGAPFRTKGRFNPRDLIPETKHYVSYEGSLTTPPCSEGVVWIVFPQPIQLSSRQLEQFLEVCGDNARPIQALHGRDLETY